MMDHQALPDATARFNKDRSNFIAIRLRGFSGIRHFSVPIRRPLKIKSLSPCHGMPATWCAIAHALSQPLCVEAHTHTAATRLMSWTLLPRGIQPKISHAHDIMRRWEAYDDVDDTVILCTERLSMTPSASCAMSTPLLRASASAANTFLGGAPSGGADRERKGSPRHRGGTTFQRAR